MKFGIMLGATPDLDASLDKFVETAKDVEKRGFSSLWLAHIRGHDAVTAMGLAGRETKRIEVGTAVTPIQPRHPMALGQQALSANAMARGRFTLGVGLSHKIVIDDMLGLRYDRLAQTMREYLGVLNPLTRGEEADFDGDIYRVKITVEVPDAPKPVSTLVAALGPMMLRVAGEMSDGTVLWMTGSNTIQSHILPGIGNAAREANRPPPRIVAGFPVLVTDDEAKGRAFVTEQLKRYGQLPSYRAMLDREGVAEPGDIALVGDAPALERSITRLGDAGATDLACVLMEDGSGSAARGLDFLQSLI